jgi:hypothetical protein
MEFNYSFESKQNAVERGNLLECSVRLTFLCPPAAFGSFFVPVVSERRRRSKKLRYYREIKRRRGVHQKNETNQPSVTTTTATVNFLHARTHRIVRH